MFGVSKAAILFSLIIVLGASAAAYQAWLGVTGVTTVATVVSVRESTREKDGQTIRSYCPTVTFESNDGQVRTKELVMSEQQPRVGDRFTLLYSPAAPERAVTNEPFGRFAPALTLVLFGMFGFRSALNSERKFRSVLNFRTDP